MPGITHVTKFCRVMPNTSGYSVWNLLHIILLASIISKWLRHFWKICATLATPVANLAHFNHITYYGFLVLVILLTFKGRMLDIFNAACTPQWPNVRYI